MLIWRKLDDMKLKFTEWLSVNSNLVQFKKQLTKTAFILFLTAGLLPVSFSEMLFWLAVFIAIFHTYLEYKFK